MELIIPKLIKAPFDRPGWIHELKLDGFRALVDTRNGCRVLSKKGYNLRRFASVCEDLPEGVVLDGELIAEDESGRPILPT